MSLEMEIKSTINFHLRALDYSSTQIARSKSSHSCPPE